MVEVSADLRYSNYVRALKQLFFIVHRPELPPTWGRELRHLTKLLRRSISYQLQAMEAAACGNNDEAFRKLDLAEDALKVSGKGVLTVELTGRAFHGSIDLWNCVMDGARDMLSTTTRKVLRP